MLTIIIAILIILLALSLKVVKEYDRGVIFRSFAFGGKEAIATIRGDSKSK